jgi:hypothetical protein
MRFMRVLRMMDGTRRRQGDVIVVSWNQMFDDRPSGMGLSIRM